ncbi:MAG: DUF3144 domain-containing protein [Sulfurovum sp.]|nr:DUF3144 domain-containing protein [Sulfurovum sp.]
MQEPKDTSGQATENTAQTKTPIDGMFYKRADSHINLANSHIQAKVAPADATNSLMFASSRFSAWITAVGFKNAEEMQKEKTEILDFFTTQYKFMLEQNFDDYVKNFDKLINDVKKYTENK